ncbi:5-carboxymethyl-2-hydroxymuconate Delta-isomerase [Kitasatospora misakiensis]|uniref:5-carboxymethyl-2-hydroxymuconate Delta-isomerase n=1 Tax=Kitasatospora misakiensis TaxID=67330 RepID=A0ABW0X9E2_9ACTN
MPQILIDHSADLDFDRVGFVDDVQRVITEVIDTAVEDCKTVFRPAVHAAVGYGTTGQAVMLVEIKILAGRSVEQRAELSARVLALLESHLTVPTAIGVEITELERATYRFVHHPGK